MGNLKYFLRINLNHQNAIAHPARVRLWDKSVLITGFCLPTGTICWQ
ncbi:hypothetical protein [Nostoc sp.]